MTDEAFEALVGKLEEQARRNPASYKVRVLLTAALGYVYLGTVLTLLAALLAAAVVSVIWLRVAGAKIAILVGAFLWVVLRALWVKVAPPEGTEVSEREAPELFAMIEELRRSLRAPRFHHVLVTDEFNAGVVQAPRLGLFGWHRNYLLIGLPLAKALTAEQFKAVLAHEFGHLANGHGALSNWIYRQRLRWSRLTSALEQSESRGIVLFRPFLRWYAPYFNAFSFPLARANEYEADAASARLASPRAAAEALTAVNVIGSYLDETYWPRIHRAADDAPQPAFAPYSSMTTGLASDIDPTAVQHWLARALARKTTLDDTHPSLTDRLGALNETPRVALPATGGSADHLLGSALESIQQAFDERWKSNILPSWEERHQTVQEGRKRLADLDAKHAASVELSLQETYDRACLTESYGEGAEAALEQFRSLHARAPEDAVVLYSLGARLLLRDDEAGCALIEHAMERDESEIVRCCQALRDYYWRGGRLEEAREWHRRLTERVALEHGAAKERDEVRTNDKFDRHDLSAEALATLQQQLCAVAGLRRAYFVRKRVRYMPDRACYVLGFTVGGILRHDHGRRTADAQRHIQESVGFPGETLILNIEGTNYRFGRKLRWMRGSRIV